MAERKKGVEASAQKKKEQEELEKINEMFDEFWSEYPRRVGKKNAYAKFIAAIKVGASFKEIMEGLRRQKTSAQWTRNNGMFVPHPATWLYGERWEDEDLDFAQHRRYPERKDDYGSVVKKL